LAGSEAAHPRYQALWKIRFLGQWVRSKSGSHILFSCFPGFTECRGSGTLYSMNRITALRPTLVGKLNERQVLRLIQRHGLISRAEVARVSGLSPPTVSKAVSSLLAAGLIEEQAAEVLGRGRPAVNLRLASESVQVIGIVIDAGECEIVTAGLDGVLHAKTLRFATPSSYAQLLNTLEKECQGLMGQSSLNTLGIGLSFPGLIDNRTGRAVLSPNLPMTNGHTPAVDLSAQLGVPCALLQEMDALCLAERHYGQATGQDDFAMLDLGAGVGLGVMHMGQLLKGQRGLAGELGHITVVPIDGVQCGCGNTGCLETVCNDAAFARRVSKKLQRHVPFDEAVDLVRSGRSPLANEIHETAVYAAVAVAAVINLFNPAQVFVHTQLFDVIDGLFDRVVELTKKRALLPSFTECRIARSKCHKRQGAVAGIVQHLTNAVAGVVE
jgi:predicted NBD/HSP70 family sugar kinase